MATYYLPFILEDDYHAFWRLLHPNLPGPYDDWLSLHRREMDEVAARGHMSADITVNPDEFGRFCRSSDKSYDLAALAAFASEKGLGHDY